jgi:hypothetical protein
VLRKIRSRGEPLRSATVRGQAERTGDPAWFRGWLGRYYVPFE